MVNLGPFRRLLLSCPVVSAGIRFAGLWSVLAELMIALAEKLRTNGPPPHHASPPPPGQGGFHEPLHHTAKLNFQTLEMGNIGTASASSVPTSCHAHFPSFVHSDGERSVAQGRDEMTMRGESGTVARRLLDDVMMRTGRRRLLFISSMCR